MDRLYHLHGVTMRTSCDRSVVAERLDAFLVHLGLEPALEGPADLVLELEAGELPAMDDQWQEVPEAAISIRRGSEAVEVREESSWIRIEAGSGRARGLFGDGPDGRGPAQMNPVSYALLTMLRNHRMYSLHAAAVEWGGSGVLIVADSGGGKSTLATYLLLSGWRFVSDDSVLVTPGGDGITVLALRRDLFVLPDSNPLASHSEPGPWKGGDKLRVDPRRGFPHLVRTSCRPRHLVFASVVDADVSRLDPCDDGQALHLLSHHSLVAELDSQGARQHLRVLADLVAQTTCHHLAGGRDLVADPGCAPRLFEGLCDGAFAHGR